MFNSARLKLTAWYLLIIMVISLLFSGIIYQLLMMEFSRFEKAQRFRFERRLVESEIISPDGIRMKVLHPQIAINSELIEETRKRIITMLISINSGILIISGMLGYVLAGRTLQPIKEMMEEQNRFISDASHEIRTPLTSLKSAFEVFLRDKKPTLYEAKSVIAESVSEVNKLQELAESLLSLAQFEKPNGHMKFKKISLDKVIIESITKVSVKAKDKKVVIDYEDSNLFIKGNEYGLIDLFVILLDNAVKYSSIDSTVLVYGEKTKGYIKIYVQDEGLGIQEKDIPHIFDRFYRADAARSKQTIGGYGLGLSIAKKIVDMHKGSIKVENNEKKGVTFIVALPIQQSKHTNQSTFFS